MRTAAAWSFPCGGCFLPAGTYSGRPYELRLPIFLQPLGGALKNRSAASASPPCFRRRRTGCGTQHPLRLACVSLAAAPTTPRCFRRWRRSSSLQSAPLLFESTLAALYKLPDKTETPVSLQHWSSWWARVDYASRAAKNSLAGCFCPAGREAPGRSCSHPPAYVSLTFAQKKTASVSLHQRFFHGRGWTTQAAHLKRPRRGLFAAGTYSGGRCCSNPPARVRLTFAQKKTASVSLHQRFFHGRGWIRTTEAEKQQIYSLSPLATREHAHILFVSVAGRLA